VHARRKENESRDVRGHSGTFVPYPGEVKEEVGHTKPTPKDKHSLFHEQRSQRDLSPGIGLSVGCELKNAPKSRQVGLTPKYSKLSSDGQESTDAVNASSD